MLQQDQPDDFVIATGETHWCASSSPKCSDYLDLDWKQYVEVDPRYFRPAEVDLLLGNSAKARKVLGWKPRVTFKELARMMTEADWAIARARTRGHRA